MNKLGISINLTLLVVLILGITQIFAATCGDVDSSGTINITDALVIARASVGLTTSTNYDSSVADVNGDGNINITDALLLAQYSVGAISTLNCAQIAQPTSVSGTYNCVDVPFWTALDHYEVAGTQVYYNGNLYENKWYSTNENPEQNSGTDKVWTLIGACDPNLTPAPTASPPPPVTWSGTPGYATRFWDCCKPHCSWPENVPAGMEPLGTCLEDGYTVNPDTGATSSCEGGNSYVCYKFIPWQVEEHLSYGFAATSSGDVCGKCYELMFTGTGKYDDTPGAVALKNKRMIVQAINIGFDVSGGQFDILVPGGGVGAFNGCSTQWGISNDQLGAQYGGLLTACMNEVGYYNHKGIKDCLRAKNDSLFRSRGLTEMAQGLDWFIDWFEAADNPNLIYREVPCPQEIIAVSGLQRP